MSRAGLIVSFAFLVAAPTLACEVSPTETVRIENVTDAVTYTLTDGRTLRLEGLGPPRAPANHEGPWPFGDDATAQVGALVRGQILAITPLARRDRYGRVIAQGVMADGTWLNGALLSLGLARVETLAAEVSCAFEALALERSAREAARGMWRLSVYQVLSVEEAAAFTNDFHLVEGLIFSADEVRGRVYLNFGPDWRTDFTVTIAPRDARRFGADGHDPLSWAGQRVRVRGWLSWYNGPQIEVDHIEQIEFIEPLDTLGGGEGDGP